jgi:hypothetical protein
MTENLHRNESSRTEKERLNLKRFRLIATIQSTFIFQTVIIKSMLKRAKHIAKFHIYHFIVV